MSENGNGVQPELPDGWEWKTLTDICEIRQGQAVPSSTYTHDENATLFLQGNAEFGEELPRPLRRTSDPRVMADDRAVLLSVRAPVGAVNLSPGAVAIGRGLAAITPRHGIDRRFVMWLLRLKRPELEAQATGTTFPAVGGRVLRGLPVPMPPLDEQHRLVALIDDLLGRVTSGNADLERGLDRIRLFERSSVAQIAGRSSPPRARLDEVGQVSVGATPRRGETSSWGGDIPWVSSGEVAFNRIASTQETITETGLGDRSKRLQPAGSVLIAMYGDGKTRGRAAILDVDAATNQAVASVRIDPDRAVPEFVYHCLVQQYEAIREIGSGTQQKNLSKRLVAAIEVPCPPLPEQREAVIEIQALHSKTQALREDVASQREASARLRRAVLNSAFVGHV